MMEARVRRTDKLTARHEGLCRVLRSTKYATLAMPDDLNIQLVALCGTEPLPLPADGPS